MINLTIFQYLPDVCYISLNERYIFSPIFFSENIYIIWIKFDAIIQTIITHLFQNVFGNRACPRSQLQDDFLIRALPVNRCTQISRSSIMSRSQGSICKRLEKEFLQKKVKNYAYDKKTEELKKSLYTNIWLKYIVRHQLIHFFKPQLLSWRSKYLIIPYHLQSSFLMSKIELMSRRNIQTLSLRINPEILTQEKPRSIPFIYSFQLHSIRLEISHPKVLSLSDIHNPCTHQKALLRQNPIQILLILMIQMYLFTLNFHKFFEHIHA